MTAGVPGWFYLDWIVMFDPTRECGGCAYGARDLVLVFDFIWFHLILIWFHLILIWFWFEISRTFVFISSFFRGSAPPTAVVVYILRPFLPTVHFHGGGARLVLSGLICNVRSNPRMTRMRHRRERFGISIWIIIHRLYILVIHSCYTSSVHSYLRSISTAAAPGWFYLDWFVMFERFMFYFISY